MSSISTWSKTAASNNAAPPDGWPENMRPSAVNDCAREMMAAVRTQWEGTEWFDFGYTPTRTGATTFTMAGDYTSVFVAKRPIRCNDSSTLYGKVVSATFGSPNTTVTVSLDSGSLTASLSSVALHALRPVASGGIVVDEDDMTSNADFKVPTQQSVKAYVGDYVSANAVSSTLKLNANRTYYVNGSTGNDSNSGLSAGAAFLTIQKGLDVASTLLMGTYAVTIQLAAGTYTATSIARSLTGAGLLIIKGATSTPSDTVINVAAAAGFDVPTGVRGNYQLQNLQMGSTSSSCVAVRSASAQVNLDNVFFQSAGTGTHISVQSGRLEINSNYTISGGATRHISVFEGGTLICKNKTITVSGSPAFTQFIQVITLSYAAIWRNTYSGAATGTRYSVRQNSVCETDGGASYFPGDVAGVTSTGGQYI